MKILFFTVGGIFLSIGLLFVVLSVASRKQPQLGLLNGQLRTCPATPNCVCSEWPQAASFVEPLRYSIAHDDAWRSMQQAVLETGGLILTWQGVYAHARYVTPIMRYVDDMELRLDEDQHVIHIRSASRVGHSDLGANRQRVDRLRTAFNKKTLPEREIR